MKELEKIVFLIPSLDPDDKMGTYVKELINAGALNILLIDDGSKKENKYHFEELKDFNEVTILTHDVNKGKGAALKTGFNFILNKMSGVLGVVTADADGQHACDDTIATAYKLLETNQVVFGTRNFNEEIVPFKSRNGNKITTIVFELLHGKHVNDTQTGLRGLPIDFVKTCIGLKGDRYEYEIMMLIQIARENRDIVELPIKTIYFESNRASHFNPVKDSIKIYKIMLGTFFKFACSGMLSTLLDLSIYTVLINLFFKSLGSAKGIFWATLLARVCSSLFNFSLNKNRVFESKGNLGKAILKYYCLAVAQMMASWLLVTFIFNEINFNTTVIKTFVDGMLFLISYQIQRRFVFREDKKC